jgi:hypothetical protein
MIWPAAPGLMASAAPAWRWDRSRSWPRHHQGRIPVGADAASLVAAPLAENALLNSEEIERLLIEAGAGAQQHSMAPPHQLGQ